jgi:hypothetical protein
MAKAKKNPQVLRLARMISIVLDEPHDDPENPSEVRIQQARQLLPQWSSAKGSLVGAVAELVNLKRGYCVRCPLPQDDRGYAHVPEDGFVCPECGRDYNKERPL